MINKITIYKEVVLLNRREILKFFAGIWAVIATGCDKEQEVPAIQTPSVEAATPKLETQRPNAPEMEGVGKNKPFDYYVDSLRGDDANAGITANAPYRSISALSGLIIIGTRIGLARGSIWREELTTINVTDIIIAAYGTGPKPIVNAANIVPEGSWSRTNGRANVYQALISLAKPLGEQWCNVLENNEFLTRANDVADCDTTPGSCYPTAEAGDITLYIHPNNSTNPNNDGKTYEVTARDHAIWVGNNSTVRDVETRNNLSASGSLVLSDSCRAYDCIARNGNSHNVQCGDGCYLNGIYAYNNYNGPSTSTLFNYYKHFPTGLGITFENCIAEMPVLSSIISGYNGHSGGEGSFGKVAWITCQATKCNTAWALLNGDEYLLDNCVTEECTYSIRTDDTAQWTINGGVLAALGRAIFISSARSKIVATNVTMIVPKKIAIYCNTDNVNLTLIGCDITAAHCFRTGDVAGLVFTSIGNRLNGSLTIYYLPTVFTYIGDNNRFIEGEVGDKFNVGGTGENLAAWKVHVAPHDANSTAPSS